MKKNIKKVSIVMAIVLVIGVVGSLFTYRAGAATVPVEEVKTFDVSAITALDIATDNSNINIYPAEGEELKFSLEGSSTRNFDYSLETEVKGSTLVAKVTESRISPINIGFSFEGVTLNIYLPEKLYEEIKINSTNGAIVAEDVEVNQLQVIGYNGRVKLDNIVSQETTIKNQNGSTQVDNHGGSLNVRSSNGRVTLNDVKGDLEVEATNGSIYFTAETIAQNINLQTSNGSISIDLVENPANSTFVLSSNNGSTKLFGESTTYKVFGDGENMIQLTSTNGSIKVN